MAMPAIDDVRLELEENPSDPTSGTYRVTYRIELSPGDLRAEHAWRERVTLVGVDDASESTPPREDELYEVSDEWVILGRDTVIYREHVTPGIFGGGQPRSTLDEDTDVIVGTTVVSGLDEVLARVELTPYIPRPTQADSPIVRAHFGPAAHI